PIAGRAFAGAFFTEARGVLVDRALLRLAVQLAHIVGGGHVRQPRRRDTGAGGRFRPLVRRSVLAPNACAFLPGEPPGFAIRHSHRDLRHDRLLRRPCSKIRRGWSPRGCVVTPSARRHGTRSRPPDRKPTRHGRRETRQPAAWSPDEKWWRGTNYDGARCRRHGRRVARHGEARETRAGTRHRRRGGRVT